MQRPARIPPHSLEAEVCVLGAILLEPRTIARVRPLLPDGSRFWREGYGTIYDACCRVAAAGSLDTVSLIEDLRTGGVLERVGGVPTVLELPERVPSAVNAEHYARIVARHWRARRMIDACASTLEALYDSRIDAVDDQVSEGLRRVAEAAEPIERQDIVTLGAAAGGLLERLEVGVPAMRPIGIEPFDSAFGGFYAEGFNLIFGASGSGKSTLAYNVAAAWAKQGVQVDVYSFEMGRDATAASILSAEADLELHRMLREGRRPGADDYQDVDEAVARVGADRVCLVEDALDAQQIHDRCVLRREQGVRAVVVDYLQNLPWLPGCRSHTESIKQSAQILQRIHRRLGMAVICVSQLTLEAGRKPEPPHFHDCLGGAEIGNVATMAVGVFREWTYRNDDMTLSQAQRDEMRYRAELWVRKHKFGQQGMAEVWFDGAKSRFQAEVPAPVWRR